MALDGQDSLYINAGNLASCDDLGVVHVAGFTKGVETGSNNEAVTALAVCTPADHVTLTTIQPVEWRLRTT
jgi:hypothetical protein